MKNKLLASAGNKTALNQAMRKYFHSDDVGFDHQGTVFNSKGRLEHYRVVEKRGRFRFEEIIT